MEFKNTLMNALGIKILKIEKGKVVASMPVDERTRQPFGLLHGGASVALACVPGDDGQACRSGL